jgi:hypothetical protein
LTDSQLDSLQGSMVSTTLQKMGYNSRTSRAITYRPTNNGGLDFQNFKIEQGVKSLHLIMHHLYFPGQPQKLLLIMLDQLQHNSGLDTPLLEDPYTPAPHLEGLWLLQVCSFLCHIQGSLQIADLSI